MSTGTLTPTPKQTFLSDAGVPLALGKVYTYAAGTSTPATTYNDPDLAPGHANANPIILDSAGRATIYLAATSYKFIVKTSADVTVYTQDNIQAVNAGGTSGLGEIFVFGGDPNSPITAAAYPSGTGFDKIHRGTAVYLIDSANLAAGTYVLEAMLVSAAGATITAAIVNLDDGAPDTPLATSASTSTTGALVQSSAISFAAAGAAKNYAIKVKASAGTGGYVWGCRLVRTV